MRKAAIILIIVLLVLVAGVGIFIATSLMPSRAKADDKDVYAYSIGEDILTNLKGEGNYVKANIIIEVKNKTSLKALEENNHKIRDKVIEILGGFNQEDTEKEVFKKELRNHIKDELIEMLKDEGIKGVYFNDFIIQ